MNDQNAFDLIECDEYRSSITKGILIDDHVTHISFSFRKKNPDSDFSSPALVLFDSNDSIVHDDAVSIEENRYIEYAEVWFDGNVVSTGARNIKVDVIEGVPDNDRYTVSMARVEDHALLNLSGGAKKSRITVAFGDSSKYAYLAITGENCIIDDITVQKTRDTISEDDIERIVPHVSYIDRMESDVPNVQVNRTRSAYTEGIEVSDKMKLVFHTMSLPSSHLVWHCAYAVLYSADDGKIGGSGYKEYALVKLNGEVEADDEHAINTIEVRRTDDFIDWNTWKVENKKGLEIEMSFARSNDTVWIYVEDSGIVTENTTKIKEDVDKVYVALTGDQCALTDIRVMR